jgi:hypothetical protein
MPERLPRRLNGSHHADSTFLGVRGALVLKTTPRLDNLRWPVQRYSSRRRCVVGLSVGASTGRDLGNRRHRVVECLRQQSLSSRPPLVTAGQQRPESDTAKADNQSNQSGHGGAVYDCARKRLAWSSLMRCQATSGFDLRPSPSVLLCLGTCWARVSGDRGQFRVV